MSPPSRKYMDYDCDGNRKLFYDHNITTQAVEEKLLEDGFRDFVIADNADYPTDEQRIVYFLYGSGFAADDSPQSRRTRVNRFLTTGAATMQRMLDIIDLHDSSEHGDESKRGLWRLAQLAILLYEKLQGAKTAFRRKKIPYVARLQASSKNSFVHGSSGTVGYKIALGQERDDYKAVSVDVPKLLRHGLHGQDLERCVVQNKGGKSKAFLKQLIAGSGATLLPLTIGTDSRIEMAASELDIYGPALVSRFRVDDSFRTKKDLSPPENQDGSVFIHQFDRIGGRDLHRFVSLGKETQQETDILAEILSANNSETTSSNSDSTSVPGMTNSTSTDTTGSMRSGFHDAGDDEDDETHDGLHAMVMIGCREESRLTGGTKYWFLIQNTWAKMPLLEVSGEYLQHNLNQRDGELVFINGELSEPPSAVDLCEGLFLEASYEDGGEYDGEDEECHDSDLEE